MVNIARTSDTLGTHAHTHPRTQGKNIFRQNGVAEGSEEEDEKEEDNREEQGEQQEGFIVPDKEREPVPTPS